MFQDRQEPTISRIWIPYAQLAQVVHKDESGRCGSGYAYLDEPKDEKIQKNCIILENVPVSWIYYMTDSEGKEIKIHRPYSRKLIIREE